ncbi:MAG TPA: ABC transporter substrate-binding protein [Rhizobiales bacterium]|nr:ABC transporter substrate-binding protein [Hyphomicrobiales bacterium]
MLSFCLVALAALAGGRSAGATTLIETPNLLDEVLAGKLPAVEARIPAEPSVVRFAPPKTAGHHGGDLRLLMGRAKDIRQVVVYGYARLVAYDEHYKIVPDILKSFSVKESRIFTFTLRKGHKWSDGHPFTVEDFRYYWEDMALDKDISPLGPPKTLLVDGKLPKFEILDEHTVRYTWEKPNPFFLPALARANPLWIYRPAHYLKQFHAKYMDRKALAALVKKAHKRTWRALHFSRDRQYRSDNPDLPSLQPWVNTTHPPADRFIFARNPYYYRIDENGRQLPYINNVIVTIASGKLIAAKVGTGEADLQGRYLQFKNYTFLKQGEKRNHFNVRLWPTARGSHMALYPNLNARDPVWRKLLRTADFRRALSLAIDRHEINQVVFYGLAIEGGNTMLPQSPLFKKDYQQRWAKLDIARANALLDKIGLKARGPGGVRLMPDGRPLEIIIETAGESSDQSDVLELIRDSWRKIGVRLFIKPTRREVLRRRAKAGSTIMSVWFGFNNGLATRESSPAELAPTRDDQLNWPAWGYHFITSGKGGKAVDMPEARKLLDLNTAWTNARDAETREKIWHKMLEIQADQVFSIGLIAGVLQPVAVNSRLRNVPFKGVYNWDPGAHFGIYRPDTFWYEKEGK